MRRFVEWFFVDKNLPYASIISWLLVGIFYGIAIDTWLLKNPSISLEPRETAFIEKSYGILIDATGDKWDEIKEDLKSTQSLEKHDVVIKLGSIEREYSFDQFEEMIRKNIGIVDLTYF